MIKDHHTEAVYVRRQRDDDGERWQHHLPQGRARLIQLDFVDGSNNSPEDAKAIGLNTKVPNAFAQIPFVQIWSVSDQNKVMPDFEKQLILRRMESLVNHKNIGIRMDPQGS